MLFDETQLLLRFQRHHELLSGLRSDPLCFKMTKRERSVYFERAFLHLQDAFFLALDQRVPSDAFFRTLLLEHTALFLKLRGPNDETALQRSLLRNDHLLQVISAALFFVVDLVPPSYFEHRDRFGANCTQYLLSMHPNLDWRLLSTSITRVLHACLPAPSDPSAHSSWRDALFALRLRPTVATEETIGPMRPEFIPILPSEIVQSFQSSDLSVRDVALLSAECLGTLLVRFKECDIPNLFLPHPTLCEAFGKRHLARDDTSQPWAEILSEQRARFSDLVTQYLCRTPRFHSSNNLHAIVQTLFRFSSWPSHARDKTQDAVDCILTFIQTLPDRAQHHSISNYIFPIFSLANSKGLSLSPQTRESLLDELFSFFKAEHLQSDLYLFASLLDPQNLERTTTMYASDVSRCFRLYPEPSTHQKQILHTHFERAINCNCSDDLSPLFQLPWTDLLHSHGAVAFDVLSILKQLSLDALRHPTRTYSPTSTAMFERHILLCQSVSEDGLISPLKKKHAL